MKKRILIIALAAIIVGCAIGGTMAYYTNQATVKNVITAGSVDVVLHEWADESKVVPFEDVQGIVPGEAVTKIIEVENIGAEAAWIRIKVTMTAKGDTVPAEDDLPISLDIGSDWEEKADGWYYYNAPLEAGDTTQPLFTTVTFAESMGNPWQNASFSMDVLMQAVQHKNNPEALGWPTT